MSTTFGIEEEFVVLDPTTLTTADGHDALERLHPSDSGVVAKEFFSSQIEFATRVCADVQDAIESLIDFRGRLGRWADDTGLLAAGSGTPYRIDPAVRLASDARYARIAEDIAGITAEHQINGMHVHVGVPDRDAGVRASNALRPWLPVLLAMSANSPFWRGTDTGFDSWRAIHSRRWTTYGAPPWFADADDYDRAVAALTGIGATSDAGTLNWNVRLSESYPTVEVRVFDAQLDPWSSLGLALVTRALVEVGASGEPGRFEVTDAALWHAARHGVRSSLIHPATGALVPAIAVLRLLRERVEDRLETPLERSCIGDLFARLAAGASGSAAQRRARAYGEHALANLYRRSLVHVPAGLGSRVVTSAGGPLSQAAH